MMCDLCGKHPATVHWTEMVNDAVTKLHLCEACAAAKGMDVANPAAFSDVLLGLGKAAAPEAASRETPCPVCHLRVSDFKKTTRLGCPACYPHFAGELAPLLAAMHKGTRHAGKVPAAIRERAQSSQTLADLRRALDRAVSAERFEEAARLRDQIRQEERAAVPGEPR